MSRGHREGGSGGYGSPDARTLPEPATALMGYNPNAKATDAARVKLRDGSTHRTRGPKRRRDK